MDKLSICFAGLARQEEAELVALFKQANGQRNGRWIVAPETEAHVLVIDMDSMYGQMSLMKALGTGKKLVALTSGGRADADYILSRPVTAASIGAMLAAFETGATPAAATAPAAAAPADVDPPAATPAPPAAPAPTPDTFTAPAAAAPVDTATRVTAEAPAAPANPAPAAAPAAAASPASTPAPADRTLADLLRPGALTGPTRVQRGDAPEVVLDPSTQTWLGGNTLKPLIPYGSATLADGDLSPVAADDLPSLEKKLGGRHPYTRLAWLCALAGGGGALMPGFNPNDKYKLLKWPQTEREFPKHFRIATVMMKGAAPLTEIAEASGVGLDEVIDYVNASLAAGVAEAEAGGPAPADPAKGGGLLGRFRR